MTDTKTIADQLCWLKCDINDYVNGSEGSSEEVLNTVEVLERRINSGGESQYISDQAKQELLHISDKQKENMLGSCQAIRRQVLLNRCMRGASYAAYVTLFVFMVAVTPLPLNIIFGLVAISLIQIVVERVVMPYFDRQCMSAMEQFSTQIQSNLPNLSSDNHTAHPKVNSAQLTGGAEPMRKGEGRPPENNLHVDQSPTENMGPDRT